VAYIDSGRGIYLWGWRQDVYDSGTGDCVWCSGERSLWPHLLDNYATVRQTGLPFLGKPVVMAFLRVVKKAILRYNVAIQEAQVWKKDWKR